MGAKKDPKKDFKPPAIGGGQTGWLDVERLPTSIKINDEWVLPRGGTMEWLMSKGYVPDGDNTNVMKPNPLTKDTKNLDTDTYRHLQLLPLIIFMFLNPRDQMIFAGITDPIKKVFLPFPI